MDFGLSEEQDLLQETVRGFVANECPPSRLREIFDAGSGDDSALWKGLAEMGLTGLAVPEVHGGAEMGCLDLALVAEVLGAGAFPGPFFGHAMACVALTQAGTEAQRAKWLPGLADGSIVGTIALGEGQGGWSPESWSCSLDGAKLSGEKHYVPHAAQADLIIVGTQGGALALVERTAAGVTIEDLDGIDRTRPVFRVGFEAVPSEALAGDAEAVSRVLDTGLVLLAADAFGAASKLIDVSVEYAQTREQFGSKIGQFQAVKHQIARLGTDIEPTRALFWHAAYAVDHLPEERSHAAALAKSHITDRAVHTARMAVELHGGIGFTWECDVQMWFKRAMFDRAFLGTPETLRERCAALADW
jgi:alkylation response protein AidB-like acyl-CoA dehydrogenase